MVGFHVPKHIKALREEQAKAREKLLKPVEPKVEKKEKKKSKKKVEKTEKKEVKELVDDEFGAFGYEVKEKED